MTLFSFYKGAYGAHLYGSCQTPRRLNLGGTHKKKKTPTTVNNIMRLISVIEILVINYCMNCFFLKI